MLGKASDNALLCNISAEDVELLASKTLNIGISILKAVPSGASNPTATQSNRFAPEVALEWLQRALLLIETAGKEGGQNVSLRRATLRGLARAHFLNSETSLSNLDGAEEAISELVQDAEMKSEEIQQLRWMSLSILKRRKVSNSKLETSFKGIIDNVAFTDVNVTECILFEEDRDYRRSIEIGVLTDKYVLFARLAGDVLQLTCNRRPLVSTVFQLFLARAVDSDNNSGHPFVARIITAQIFVLMSSPEGSEAIDVIQNSLKIVSRNPNFTLDKVSAAASEWFKLSADPVFGATSEANLRNAFLFERLRKWSPLLTSTGKMLLLATKLAHEQKMRSLLLSILEQLLSTLSSNAPLETEVKAFTLLRCTVRVIIELLNEPEAEMSVPSTLTRHLHTAVELVKAADSKKSASLIIKDVSWLWRIVYNTGIEGCKGWDPFQVSELFLLSRQVMLLYRPIVVAQADTELEHHAQLALFSSICCRVFGLRGLDTSEDTVAVRRTLRVDIKTFREESKSMLLVAQPGDAKLEGLLNLSFVLDVEQICLLREWDDLKHIMDSIGHSPHSVSSVTFEAIFDLIWAQQSCPTSVLYATLETILASTANRGYVDSDRYSHWLRAIVKILLARAREPDRQRALRWIRQGVDVMRCGTDESPHPQDEQQYMLATCFNVGLECLKFVTTLYLRIRIHIDAEQLE
ncbi:hypothetical protein FRB90_006598 [Tulasnella sp. 427]|nr:hypothetical protein FRB90_006598 [Tulasnella sp. 427]